MDDRELLELAARAAGIGGGWGDKVDYHNGEVDLEGYWMLDAEEMTFWDPLVDDGDALRLAAALRIGIAFSLADGSPTAYRDRKYQVIGCHESAGNDPGAATRRAIVRAAAEIGKTMQENS